MVFRYTNRKIFYVQTNDGDKNFREFPLSTVHVALQHGDRIGTIDYCDVTAHYVSRGDRSHIGGSTEIRSHLRYSEQIVKLNTIITNG